jgi:hypothetical protein
MNSLDKITLRSFLAAVLRQNSSLPDAFQKKLNEVSATFATKINILDLLTEEYQPLEDKYLEARAMLQNDGERKRSSAVETIALAEISDEAVLNFAAKVLSVQDSVEFLKRAYAKSSEVRSLFKELDYPDLKNSQAVDIPFKTEESDKKTQTHYHKIFDIVGKKSVAMKDGQKVYDLIHPQLLANQSVELDFSGIKLCPPPFLNSAIGQLLEDIEIEKFHRLLKISNLHEVGKQTLKLVVESSQEYYSDPNFRSRVDRAISEYADAF